MMYEAALHPLGAQIWLGEELILELDIDEFNYLAHSFADAALQAQGFESVTCRADEVQVGDQFLEREVINIRTRSGDQTSITTKPFGWMVFQCDHRLTVERPIR